MRRLLPTLSIVTLIASISAANATIAYQNTTTPVSAYVFNGATTTTLATNIDINLLGLAPGFANDAVNSISFNAYNINPTPVSAQIVLDVWAANGTAGLPGTLLATTTLGLQTLAASAQTTITATFSPSALIVPAANAFYVGVGYTNGGGTSPITATQLNNLGGLTFNPASVGNNNSQAYFAAPGTTGSNPVVSAFGAPFQADYGFSVNVPEPASVCLVLTGLIISGVRRGRRRAR